MRGQVHEVGAPLDPTLYIPSESLDMDFPAFGDDIEITVPGFVPGDLGENIPPSAPTVSLDPAPTNGANGQIAPHPAIPGGSLDVGPEVADQALITQMAIDAENAAQMEKIRRMRFWLWVGGAGLLGYLIGRTQ